MTELERYWENKLDAFAPMERDDEDGVELVSLESELARFERQMRAEEAMDVADDEDWTPTTASAGLRRYARGRTSLFEDEMASYERAMDFDRLDVYLNDCLAPTNGARETSNPAAPLNAAVVAAD